MKTRVVFWVTLEPLSDTTWRAHVSVEMFALRAFSITLKAELMYDSRKSVSFSFFNGASVAERPDESASIVSKIANDNELKSRAIN